MYTTVSSGKHALPSLSLSISPCRARRHRCVSGGDSGRVTCCTPACRPPSPSPLCDPRWHPHLSLMSFALFLEKKSHHDLGWGVRGCIVYLQRATKRVRIVLSSSLSPCCPRSSSGPQEHASGQTWIVLFEVLEVFRRWGWIFFRVEWECISKKVGEDAGTLPPQRHPRLPPIRRRLGWVARVETGAHAYGC